MKKCLLGLVLLASTSATSQAQNYFLGTSADGIYEYTILNATVDRKMGVVEAFTRIKPSDGKLAEFKDLETKARQKQNLDIEGFDKLAYYRRKTQYSCKGKKCRIVEIIYYDSKGKIIDQEDRNDKAKWEVIPAGTMRDMEFKKVCEGS